jgi:TM2 domain-containing membrane protein YozV
MPFCTKCGAEVPPTSRFCQRCGAEQPSSAPPVVVVAPVKSPIVAVILSFFISGLGQFYNGEIGKGFWFLIGYFVAWICFWALIWLPVIHWLPTTVVWVWGMVDAYQSAERINRESRQVLPA